MLVSHRIVITAIAALALVTGVIVGIYLDNRFIIILFCCAKYVIMMPLVGYLFPNCWRMFRYPEYENKSFLLRLAGEENIIIQLIAMEVVSYVSWWKLKWDG